MFSNSCKYALRAVLFLAQKGEDKKKFSAKEIATSLGIPPHFLAKLLQQLAKHNLVSSMKGKFGGFHLSESNLGQPLIKVIEQIDGCGFMDGCVMGLDACSDSNPCPLHEITVTYKKGLRTMLNNKKISELANLIEKEKFVI